MIWTTRKHWLSNKLMNRRIKSQNGNSKLKQAIKVYHWNRRNGWWERSLDEIETIVAEKSPDLLFISEANLRNEVEDMRKKISQVIQWCSLEPQPGTITQDLSYL